jgi:hypothetical protein
MGFSHPQQHDPYGHIVGIDVMARAFTTQYTTEMRHPRNSDDGGVHVLFQVLVYKTMFLTSKKKQSQHKQHISKRKKKVICV